MIKNINIDLRDNKKYTVQETNGETYLVEMTEEEFKQAVDNLTSTK